MPSSRGGSVTATRCGGSRSEAVKRRIRWVPEAAVRAIHAAMVAEHGGRSGIRDSGLLSAALARPRNRRAYGTSATLFDLAAAYGFAIAKDHPFVDGNKRVALMVMYVFLEINGYQLDASEVETVEMMLNLASGEMTGNDLALWIKTNSRSSADRV